MCLRLKPLAGIWRHEAKRQTPRYTQKATAINKGKTPLHQCRREYGARWLRMEDRKAPLIKVVFSDLDRIKAKSLESAIFKIGSSAKTKDLIFKWRRDMRLLRRLGMNYPWWPRAKGLIESPYEPVYSHNTVSPWEVQTGSRCVMPKSTRILWWIA